MSPTILGDPGLSEYRVREQECLHFLSVFDRCHLMMGCNLDPNRLFLPECPLSSVYHRYFQRKGRKLKLRHHMSV